MIAPNTVLDQCESTNDLARKLLQDGAPHGTWISARVQTAGRGRQGRTWVSQEGNLFLSVVLRLNDARSLSWVPLAGAVVIADALMAHWPVECARLKIKWPNDLWLETGPEFAKVGGILCEGQSTAQGAGVVFGVGINCAHAPEVLDRLALPAIALDIPVEDVRAQVVFALPAGINRLEREGPEWVRARFEALSALPAGSEVEWTDSAPGRGTVLGLGAQGELRVRDETTQRERSLFAEEVRLRRWSR